MVQSFLPFIFFATANAIAVNTTTKQQRIDKLFEAFEQVQQKMHIPGLNMALITPKSSDSPANNNLPYDVFFKSAGVRNASSKEPIDKNTVHLIASTTKLFTAHVVAMLEERGLVDWNTPVKNYADVSFFDKTIHDNANLIDLLSHSTGVGDIVEFVPKKGNALDFIKEAESLPPVGEFRKSFRYSNYMFSLAGSIASNVLNVTSNDPYEGWRLMLKEKVFGQLGMNSATVDFESFMNTSFPVEALHIWQPSNSTEFKYRIEPRKALEMFYHTISPAGEIALSIKDYSKWLMYLLDMSQNGKSSMANIVSKKNHDLIFAPHNDFLKDAAPDAGSYGLGVVIHTYEGHRVFYHDGESTGQTTQMCVLPDDGYALAFFSNSESSPNVLVACKDIVDQFILNQELSQAGNKTLTYMNKILAFLDDAVKNNTNVIQKHSLTPILPPSQPKQSYVGTFNYTEFKHSLFTTTIVSETPFRLKFLPTNSYESCAMDNLCFTVQHWSGNQFFKAIGDALAPIDGIFTFNFDGAGKLEFVNKTIPAV